MDDAVAAASLDRHSLTPVVGAALGRPAAAAATWRCERIGGGAPHGVRGLGERVPRRTLVQGGSTTGAGRPGDRRVARGDPTGRPGTPDRAR